MKLIKTKSEIQEIRDVPGLMSFSVKHEIKSSTASARYSGPKIPVEVWEQILSFFQWTYNATKSECQVQLFVNVKEKTWRAWAFPQRIKTGMTTHELSEKELGRETIETAEMTEARYKAWGFPVSGDWIQFGTVHHHCSTSAFQSGTDESNEKNQSGLHITVGNVDAKQHSLHCRFYRDGLQFDPDMSELWDVGDPWSSAPDDLVDKDGFARLQMCNPSKVPFPEEWKSNLMEVKEAPIQAWGLGYSSHGFSDWPRGSYTYDPSVNGFVRKEETGKTLKSQWERILDAISEIEANVAVSNLREDELEEAFELLEEIDRSEACDIILKACQRHDVDSSMVYREYDPVDRALKEQKKESWAATDEPTGYVMD